MLLILSWSACADQEEAKRQQLIQQQIGTVQRELQGINAGHDELQARVKRMRELLAAADTELAKSDARVFGVNAIIPYLRELTLYGFGETPAQWIVRNPDLGPSVLVPAFLFLLFVWLMWRIRQRQLEHKMSAEIDRVIRNLSARAASVARPGGKEAGTGAPEGPRRDPPARKAPDPADRPPPGQKARKADAGASLPEKPGPSAGEEINTPEGPRRQAAAKDSGQDLKSGPAGKAAAPKPARPAPAAARPRAPSSRKTAKKKAERPAAAKKCKVKGCGNKHRSKGYCNKHYQQWRKGVLPKEVEGE